MGYLWTSHMYFCSGSRNFGLHPEYVFQTLCDTRLSFLWHTEHSPYHPGISQKPLAIELMLKHGNRIELEHCGFWPPGVSIETSIIYGSPFQHFGYVCRLYPPKRYDALNQFFVQSHRIICTTEVQKQLFVEPGQHPNLFGLRTGGTS